MSKTGAELRSAFLSYFGRNGHRILPSASLVPGNDPTLLFTNAGMVQFKEFFLGTQVPESRRATTAQRCLRVSGKHNDLENVGYTARHHTLFEMLGNFSFGDYFKKDAIAFAWEFLTKEVGLDGKRMTASVFRDDDEAYDLWHKGVGLPASQIVRFGEKDNFWSMGATGPCGPCSEILYDQGEGTGCGKPTCNVGCDCDRYLEIWNLVFMQFEQADDGTRTSLPKPSIDTGMGLERLAAVVQGKVRNYDTDLFLPLIHRISTLSGVAPGASASSDASMRVIADHARATAFLIADGVQPSNEGRGYVLRRIMRRALRHGKKLGLDGPFLHQVAETVVSEFAGACPDLGARASDIDRWTVAEENQFLRTLDRGLSMVEDEFARMTSTARTVFAGDVAFRLYDSCGFPVDLTADLCRERGVSLDQAGFDEEMEKQRDRSRAGSKIAESAEKDPVAVEAAKTGWSTAFVGYDRFDAEANVVALFKGGGRVASVAAGEEADLVASVTPFYGDSGGQVGDSGASVGKDFRLEVSATRKTGDGLVVHRVKVLSGTVSEGDAILLSVDSPRRRRTQANHTATHLLQAALREVLGGHVQQKGSAVGPDKLRFDFAHFEAMTTEQVSAVERAVNDAVFAGRPVSCKEMSFDAAKAEGAMAFFGEKYGEVVRLVAVDGVSKELCGGTHVANTMEIAIFRVVAESALASGVRRIEAVTGPVAAERLRDEADRLHSLARELKVPPAEVAERVRKIQAQVKSLEKDVVEAKRRGAKDLVSEVMASASETKGVMIVSAKVEPMDAASLRDLADKVKGKLGSGLLLLASIEGDRCNLVAGVSDDLIKTYSASEIVKKAAACVGGGGGGRKDMAQAGGGKVDGVDDALASLFGWIA